MASELLFATRSRHKLAEIQAILGSAPRFELITLTDLAIEESAAEHNIEAHPTFLANAIAKAHYFASLTGMRTLADDSGIMVDALGGEPGVRTKRFALDRAFVPTGTASAALDEANNRLLLQLLADTPEPRRNAHYVCAAALAAPERLLATAIGTCRGIIARAPKGRGGFGYDPIFRIPHLDVTFAELTPEQKNQQSHRAKAFRALAPHLKSFEKP